MRTEQVNKTAVVEFIILGFQSIPAVQFTLFLMFLVIYITTVLGNLLIMVLVVTDHHLHNPMFFFLGNLSFLETCYTSTILPRMLANFLTNKYAISLQGCFLQYFFFTGLAGAECCLLTVMSYDRYIAICKPLHYTTIMNNRCCLQLASVSWASGLLASATVTSLMPQLTFCGPNEIDHFFCDFTPVVNLSCSDTHCIELVEFILASLLTLPLFLLTLLSYVYISNTVLRIPSSAGRHKAFSTCSSHLTVVTLFYGTLMVVYLVPKSNRLRDLHKVFSVCYTVLTPLVNPLIYSLRNNNIRKALRTAVNKYSIFHKA
ncbi:olfactory receptor 6N1-like [Pezoporus wallicus]|uniref:olfactory receptor 6N1-like n=1 Tax=Pezoporus wallicus TaxID=35540 RepID=UPI00254A2805|nr:olfactory receptor 6N1-like [Pezoporus wallicus]